jgi:hypothetical protein
LRAHGARERAALLERAGQKRGLPFGRADLRAELEVLGVLQAQDVAVAQQPALAVQHQHRGVVQQREAASRRERGADEEVAVAVHEEHRHALGGAAQQFGALRLEAGLAAASSPTHTSNRSPRMMSASAGVVCR